MAFCGSFLFSGGPHGPAGPMFVLTGTYAPLRSLARWLVPAEQSSEQLDLLLMFAVVIANGALYGLVAAVIVAAWRAAFHKRGRSDLTVDDGSR